ncbi:MAG TPA: hypothetical protein VIR54_27045 [Vicinamibacterales bacterium]
MSNATMLTLLAVLQALTVAGILGAIGFAFHINGQLSAILARLNLLEPVTGRVQDLNDKVLQHEGELATMRVRVDYVERQLTDDHSGA